MCHGRSRSLFRRSFGSSGAHLTQPIWGARWATGSALEIIWDDAYFDELVDLATDVRYGRGREMVVLGFAKSKHPEADQVLLGLLADRDVNGHAVSALRKRKVRLPASVLGGLLRDDRTWVRKEAQKVLE